MLIIWKQLDYQIGFKDGIALVQSCSDRFDVEHERIFLCVCLPANITAMKNRHLILVKLTEIWLYWQFFKLSWKRTVFHLFLNLLENGESSLISVSLTSQEWISLCTDRVNEFLTPLPFQKGQNYFFSVPLDEQCSETHVKTISWFFYIFSFNKIFIYILTKNVVLLRFCLNSDSGYS